MHVVWCGVLVLFYFILYFFRFFSVFIFSALYGINAIAYMQAAQPNQSITQMCANKKKNIYKYHIPHVFTRFLPPRDAIFMLTTTINKCTFFLLLLLFETVLENSFYSLEFVSI